MREGVEYHIVFLCDSAEFYPGLLGRWRSGMNSQLMAPHCRQIVHLMNKQVSIKYGIHIYWTMA